jgi:HEAT repeat protein
MRVALRRAATLSLSLFAFMGCDRGRPHLRDRSVQEWLAVARDSAHADLNDVITALVQLSTNYESSRGALADGLDDESPVIRLVSVETIRRLPYPVAQAAPALTRLVLRDPEAQIRAAAAQALGEVTEGEPWSVSTLEAALRDSAAMVRAGALDGVAAIGSPARRLISQIQAIERSDPDSVVRARARAARTALRTNEGRP